jgi:hypothetical protein
MGFSKQSLKISLENVAAKGLIAEKNIQMIKSKTA